MSRNLSAIRQARQVDTGVSAIVLWELERLSRLRRISEDPTSRHRTQVARTVDHRRSFHGVAAEGECAPGRSIGTLDGSSGRNPRPRSGRTAQVRRGRSHPVARGSGCERAKEARQTPARGLRRMGHGTRPRRDIRWRSPPDIATPERRRGRTPARRSQPRHTTRNREPGLRRRRALGATATTHGTEATDEGDENDFLHAPRRATKKPSTRSQIFAGSSSCFANHQRVPATLLARENVRSGSTSRMETFAVPG